MEHPLLDPNAEQSIDACYHQIAAILLQARRDVVAQINDVMVEAYWQIGQIIVEVEQKGQERAGYGEKLIKSLSVKLTRDLGRGFSPTLLKRIRQFYLRYPKGATVWHQSNQEKGLEKGATLWRPLQKWPLSWSHYRLLVTLDSASHRSFYEIEAVDNNWSVRELERQMDTFLFERLAKSKDPAGLLALIKKGQEILTPADAIKDPFIFEFLNLPTSGLIKESDVEGALIDNLQHFLLVLGKGFSLVARQKRLTFDGQHLFVDLVMYHTILKSYILIDLKIDKLTHGDLGQMQVYINYFDQECRQEDDNPTIGLILCPRSNEKLVQYFFGDNAQRIYSRQYRLHLPTEEELSKELQRELYNITLQLKEEEDEIN